MKAKISISGERVGINHLCGTINNKASIIAMLANGLGDNYENNSK